MMRTFAILTVALLVSGRSLCAKEVSEAETELFWDTQKGVTVNARVIPRDEKVFKIELISQPPGAVKLESVRLISPEGVAYAPSQIYDVSEQAARNLGRLRPIPVPKSKKSKSSMTRIGSALLGAGLSTALSGASPSHSSAYSAGKYGAEAAKHTSSGLSTVGLVGGLAPLAMSGTGSHQAGREDIEWVEPKTAGTGIFSSVAEFERPTPSPSQEPWQLKAEMKGRGDSSLTYTFNLYPVPPLPSVWEKIELTGSSSKLL